MTSRSLILLLIVSLSTALSAQQERTVRILTFNIYHGATMKGDFNLDVLADVIKDVEYEFDLHFAPEDSDDDYNKRFGVILPDKFYEPKYTYKTPQHIGDHKVRFKFNESGRQRIEIVMANAYFTDHPSRKWTFTINSLKMTSDSSFVATEPIAVNSNLTGIDSQFQITDGISQKELAIIEKWDEKISDRDAVFPLGNTQNYIDPISGFPRWTPATSRETFSRMRTDATLWVCPAYI